MQPAYRYFMISQKCIAFGVFPAALGEKACSFPKNKECHPLEERLSETYFYKATITQGNQKIH